MITKIHLSTHIDMIVLFKFM